MVEIGGEVKTKGKNKDRQDWRLGIIKPEDETEIKELSAIIRLSNKALATSGNYNKYYLKDGVKYSHTIDPGTGAPVNHTLLSASIVTDNTSTADAFATAFMVWGLEKSKKYLEENEGLGLDAFFIYSKEDGTMGTFVTSGMRKILEER